MKANMFKFESEKHKISLRFYEGARDYVLERQWFPNQEEELSDDGTLILTFENEINLMLLGWIRGFGPDVEVLGPEILRDRTIKELKESRKNYLK